MGALQHPIDARQVLANRDLALEKVAQGIDALTAARRLANVSHCPVLGYFSNLSRDQALNRYRWEADKAGWWRLMKASGLWPLMDEMSRIRWRQELEEKRFPPLTAEAIEKKFSDLFDRRHDMLENEVENVFRGISWESGAPVALPASFRVNHFASIYQIQLPENLGGMVPLVRLLAVMEGSIDAEHVATDFRVSCMSASDERRASCAYLSVQWFKNGKAKVQLEPEAMVLVDRLHALLAKRWPEKFQAVEGWTVSEVVGGKKTIEAK